MLDSDGTGFCCQIREPPLENPGLCVLRVWVPAQVFQDRPHSLSYAWFVHASHLIRRWTTKEQHLGHTDLR